MRGTKAKEWKIQEKTQYHRLLTQVPTHLRGNIVGGKKKKKNEGGTRIKIALPLPQTTLLPAVAVFYHRVLLKKRDRSESRTHSRARAHADKGAGKSVTE